MNGNFIDKTFTINYCDILLRGIPTTSEEKEAFTFELYVLFLMDIPSIVHNKGGPELAKA